RLRSWWDQTRADWDINLIRNRVSGDRVGEATNGWNRRIRRRTSGGHGSSVTTIIGSATSVHDAEELRRADAPIVIVIGSGVRPGRVDSYRLWRNCGAVE